MCGTASFVDKHEAISLEMKEIQITEFKSRSQRAISSTISWVRPRLVTTPFVLSIPKLSRQIRITWASKPENLLKQNKTEDPSGWDKTRNQFAIQNLINRKCRRVTQKTWHFCLVYYSPMFPACFPSCWKISADDFISQIFCLISLIISA